ncbi:hypothetical protein [Paenibacillus abyssi]|uniref:Uncharacterized protein n=1 Tax=Paenibacillus abyssi TaxID=1340531 RepID=A0A917G1J0_9BACL|nr:hypothetical protein [Paenibacillus abyssi]GGG17696.1 hypothetical protein GCM10010916_38170 [Paenibacillus abyssi]
MDWIGIVTQFLSDYGPSINELLRMIEAGLRIRAALRKDKPENEEREAPLKEAPPLPPPATGSSKSA